MNIVHAFLNRARSHPHLAAVSCSGQTISFAELAARSHALAAVMVKEFQLAAGSRVVICMENRAAFFETLFASWIAGMCAVPVNAKLHPKEVRQIASDCGTSLVFTSDYLLEGLLPVLSDAAQAAPLVSVDTDAYRGMLRRAPLPCMDMQPDDVAWLFYTSGTTGVPKGAMLTHRNLLSMCLHYGADIDYVMAGDTMLHLAPLSHGAGQYSLPHIFNGGHQVIEKSFSPDLLLEGLQRYPRVSLFAAPTMITRALRTAEGLSNAGGNLQALIYGGAPMYVSDLLKTLDVFGPRLVQIYGQGESPMTITQLSRQDHQGNGDAAHLARLASCGIARMAVQVRVVDDDGHDLPTGEPGEIITRSDTRMLGYWNNPKATASAIREGWLWTGDIGSLDELGYLTLRDRSKDMIIRGGSNIYPREIEEVLLRHPAVSEVSVIGAESADLGEEPVAFVVLKNGMSVTAQELDSLCLDNIARFKRPREYFFRQDLPKNNYGKILKTALRQLFKQGDT